MKCPGQDTQFWRPDDIFEVFCGQCGYSVEFFKTDISRICPGCGTIIRNPRQYLGKQPFIYRNLSYLECDISSAFDNLMIPPPRLTGSGSAYIL